MRGFGGIRLRWHDRLCVLSWLDSKNIQLKKRRWQTSNARVSKTRRCGSITHPLCQFHGARVPCPARQRITSPQVRRVGCVITRAPWLHFPNAGRASALPGLISRARWVQLPSLRPFQGPLAQSVRATACRAEGRGSKARTDRQFHGCGAVLWTAFETSAETAEPHFSSLRSSTAEHSPDKRETVEHHHAEGPFQTPCIL